MRRKRTILGRSKMSQGYIIYNMSCTPSVMLDNSSDTLPF